MEKIDVEIWADGKISEVLEMEVRYFTKVMLPITIYTATAM